MELGEGFFNALEEDFVIENVDYKRGAFVIDLIEKQHLIKNYGREKMNNDYTLDAIRFSGAPRANKSHWIYGWKLNRLPKKVQFNDKKKATTIIDDNKVTVVKTMKDDKYNKEFGFLMAYFQHYSGLSKTQAKKYLKGLLDE